MFKILVFIVLLLLLIGFMFGFSVFRFFFRTLNPPAQSDKQNRRSANNQSDRTQNQSKKQKKIIDSNEGEYIDYEEIKD